MTRISANLHLADYRVYAMKAPFNCERYIDMPILLEAANDVFEFNKRPDIDYTSASIRGTNVVGNGYVEVLLQCPDPRLIATIEETCPWTVEAAYDALAGSKFAMMQQTRDSIAVQQTRTARSTRAARRNLRALTPTTQPPIKLENGSKTIAQWYKFQVQDLPKTFKIERGLRKNPTSNKLMVENRGRFPDLQVAVWRIDWMRRSKQEAVKGAKSRSRGPLRAVLFCHDPLHANAFIEHGLFWNGKLYQCRRRHTDGTASKSLFPT